MNYVFDIVSVTPVLNFFNYQQEVEQTPQRSRAYLGSYNCTLDGFIQSTDLVYQKPHWNWDEAVTAIVNFWLDRGDRVRHWQQVFQQSGDGYLIVGRIANLGSLRREFEQLLDD